MARFGLHSTAFHDIAWYMCGPEVSQPAEIVEDQGECGGTDSVPAGGEPHWVDAFLMGENGAPESREPPLAGRLRVHDVYALVDGRDGSEFYIGYTRQWPKQRLYGHCHDPASAAYDRIREIWAAGKAVSLRVLASYETREEALLREAHEIKRRKGLVNRSPGNEFAAVWYMSRWEPEQPKYTPDPEFQEYERQLGEGWVEPA